MTKLYKKNGAVFIPSEVTIDDFLEKVQEILKVAFKDGAEFGYNKLNEELKEKISVLLSCKNCPENKGGWICAKEYENKCLAQKIVFIQELKKENAKLKKELKISQRCWQDQKNISLNANCSLHKAKELIEELSSSLSVVGECDDEECELLNRAEQFLKDSVNND